MKRWIARTFHKGDYIVINIITSSKNVKRDYEIPKGDQITIKKKAQTFTIGENMIVCKNREPNIF